MTDQVQGTANADVMLQDAMLEQVAAFRARTAIARWQLGAPALGERGGMLLRSSPQARHLKRMERLFEQWLLEGGFQRDGQQTQPAAVPCEE